MATTAWLSCLITAVKINFAVVLTVVTRESQIRIRSIQTCDSVSNFRSHFRLNDFVFENRVIDWANYKVSGESDQWWSLWTIQ